jgi:hypothetical protein
MRLAYRLRQSTLLRMSAGSSSAVVDRLVSSYFELPVRIHWRKATGAPFPDHFEEARLELSGLATAWVELKQVVWLAASVRFVPGLPATVEVKGPRVQIAVGKLELDRWLKRFDLPYRLELAKDALIVHTEIAGFPLAELEARLEVVNGWFVLQPKRASVLGVPNYVATLFRTYLPLPPLSGNIQLDAIAHEPDVLRLTFTLEDFEEQVTPGLLGRLQKRLIPTLELPFLAPRRP